MLLARLTVASLLAIAASCGSAAPLAEAAASNVATPAAANLIGATGSQPAEPAAVPLARLPAEIQAWARDKRQECAESGERVTAETFKPHVLDLNGDNRPDYVIAAADTFECQSGLTLWSANQSPIHDILLSTPRGYRWAEDSVDSMGIEVGSHGGKPVLMAGTGGPGAWERPYSTYAYGWNGRELARLAFFDGDGRQVNEDGTRPGGGGWASAPFPEGLPSGFYSESCWPADPDGMGYVHLTARAWREWDGISPIAQIERNGPVRYRFHTVNEDEAGNRTPSRIDIQTHRIGEFSLIYEGEEPRFYSRCEDREVPAQVRRDQGGR